MHGGIFYGSYGYLKGYAFLPVYICFPKLTCTESESSFKIFPMGKLNPKTFCSVPIPIFSLYFLVKDVPACGRGFGLDDLQRSHLTQTSL